MVVFSDRAIADIELVIILALATTVCVALYSMWPKWSWEKGGRHKGS